MAGTSTYTEEFAKKAAHAFRNRGGKTIDEVADELGVHKSQLYRWADKYLGPINPSRPANPTPNRSRPPPVAREDEQEVARLQRENDQLREEREVLKRTIVVFAKPGDR